MIDIAVYDEEMNRKLIENIVIDSKEWTQIPQEKLSDLGKVKFIVLNVDGHAYVTVRMDERSRKNILGTSPTKIENKIDRMLL
jgi:hypothetical protein